MRIYVGVKFREQGQIYYFDSAGYSLFSGGYVIVSTEEGPGMARVVSLLEEPPAHLGLEENGVKPIERPATDEDFVQQESNDQLAAKAFAFCREKIKELELDMKLVDVEVRFDQSKLVFYFTAPTRIDFRELVKLLVNEYRTRIELRQIGVRHEAQILGGIGNCGRICCCHQFLKKFEPVTIKMAKEQQLFLNPSKISGTCGRLLCCLNFEKETYADFQRRCPKVGKRYDTSVGEIKVLRANLFRDSLIVDAGDGEEKEITLPEWADLSSSQELKPAAKARPEASKQPAGEAKAAPSAKKGKPKEGRQEGEPQKAAAQEKGSGEADPEQQEDQGRKKKQASRSGRRRRKPRAKKKK
jgi:cell fate regulator YaaT (PSP1 superfamily)